MASQNAIPSKQHLGGSLPFAFNEEGVADLTAVLKSERAGRSASRSCAPHFVCAYRLFWRLTPLEEYHAHFQLHGSKQDKVILELRDEVSRLKREFSRQRDLLHSAGSTSVPNERPPHY